MTATKSPVTLSGQVSRQTRYDAEEDILTIKLRKGVVDHAEKDGDLVTHYDTDGQPLLIEVFRAKTKTV